MSTMILLCLLFSTLLSSRKYDRAVTAQGTRQVDKQQVSTHTDGQMNSLLDALTIYSSVLSLHPTDTSLLQCCQTLSLTPHLDLLLVTTRHMHSWIMYASETVYDLLSDSTVIPPCLPEAKPSDILPRDDDDEAPTSAAYPPLPAPLTSTERPPYTSLVPRQALFRADSYQPGPKRSSRKIKKRSRKKKRGIKTADYRGRMEERLSRHTTEKTEGSAGRTGEWLSWHTGERTLSSGDRTRKWLGHQTGTRTVSSGGWTGEWRSQQRAESTAGSGGRTGEWLSWRTGDTTSGTGGRAGEWLSHLTPMGVMGADGEGSPAVWLLTGAALGFSLAVLWHLLHRQEAHGQEDTCNWSRDLANALADYFQEMDHQGQHSGLAHERDRRYNHNHSLAQRMCRLRRHMRKKRGKRKDTSHSDCQTLTISNGSSMFSQLETVKEVSKETNTDDNTGQTMAHGLTSTQRRAQRRRGKHRRRRKSRKKHRLGGPHGYGGRTHIDTMSWEMAYDHASTLHSPLLEVTTSESTPSSQDVLRPIVDHIQSDTVSWQDSDDYSEAHSVGRMGSPSHSTSSSLREELMGPWVSTSLSFIVYDLDVIDDIPDEVLEVVACDAHPCDIHPHDRYHYVASKIIVQRLPLHLASTADEVPASTYLSNIMPITCTEVDDIDVTINQEISTHSQTAVPKKHVRIAEDIDTVSVSMQWQEPLAEESEPPEELPAEEIHSPQNVPTEEFEVPHDEDETLQEAPQTPPKSTNIDLELINSAVNTDILDTVDCSIQTIGEPQQSAVSTSMNTDQVSMKDAAPQTGPERGDELITIGVNTEMKEMTNTSLQASYEMENVSVNTELSKTVSVSVQVSVQKEESNAGVNTETVKLADFSMQTSFQDNLTNTAVNTEMLDTSNAAMQTVPDTKPQVSAATHTVNVAMTDVLCQASPVETAHVSNQTDIEPQPCVEVASVASIIETSESGDGTEERFPLTIHMSPTTRRLCASAAKAVSVDSKKPSVNSAVGYVKEVMDNCLTNPSDVIFRHLSGAAVVGGPLVTNTDSGRRNTFPMGHPVDFVMDTIKEVYDNCMKESSSDKLGSPTDMKDYSSTYRQNKLKRSNSVERLTNKRHKRKLTATEVSPKTKQPREFHSARPSESSKRHAEENTRRVGSHAKHSSHRTRTMEASGDSQRENKHSYRSTQEICNLPDNCRTHSNYNHITKSHKVEHELSQVSPVQDMTDPQTTKASATCRPCQNGLHKKAGQSDNFQRRADLFRELKETVAKRQLQLLEEEQKTKGSQSSDFKLSSKTSVFPGLQNVSTSAMDANMSQQMACTVPWQKQKSPNQTQQGCIMSNEQEVSTFLHKRSVFGKSLDECSGLHKVCFLHGQEEEDGQISPKMTILSTNDGVSRLDITQDGVSHLEIRAASYQTEGQSPYYFHSSSIGDTIHQNVDTLLVEKSKIKYDQESVENVSNKTVVSPSNKRFYSPPFITNQPPAVFEKKDTMSLKVFDQVCEYQLNRSQDQLSKYQMNRSLDNKRESRQPVSSVANNIREIYDRCMSAVGAGKQVREMACDSMNSSKRPCGPEISYCTSEITGSKDIYKINSQQNDTFDTDRPQFDMHNYVFVKKDSNISQKADDNGTIPVLPLVFLVGNKSPGSGTGSQSTQDSSNSAERVSSGLLHSGTGSQPLQGFERKEPYKSLSKASLKEPSPPLEVSDRAKNNVFGPVGWTSPRSGITSLFRGQSQEKVAQADQVLSIQHVSNKQDDNKVHFLSGQQQEEYTNVCVANENHGFQKNISKSSPLSETINAPNKTNKIHCPQNQSSVGMAETAGLHSSVTEESPIKENHYCNIHPDMVEFSKAGRFTKNAKEMDFKYRAHVYDECKPRIMSVSGHSKQKQINLAHRIDISKERFPSKFLPRYTLNTTRGANAASEQTCASFVQRENDALQLGSKCKVENSLSERSLEQEERDNQEDNSSSCSNETDMTHGQSSPSKSRQYKYNDLNEELKAKLAASKLPFQVQRGKRKSSRHTSTACDNVRTTISMNCTNAINPSVAKAKSRLPVPSAKHSEERKENNSHNYRITFDNSDQSNKISQKYQQKIQMTFDETCNGINSTHMNEKQHTHDPLSGFLTKIEDDVYGSSQTETGEKYVPAKLSNQTTQLVDQVVNSEAPKLSRIPVPKGLRKENLTEGALTFPSKSEIGNAPCCNSAMNFKTADIYISTEHQDAVISKQSHETSQVNEQTKQRISEHINRKKAYSKLPVRLSSDSYSSYTTPVKIESRKVSSVIASRIKQLQDSVSENHASFPREVQHIKKLTSYLGSDVDTNTHNDKPEVTRIEQKLSVTSLKSEAKSVTKRKRRGRIAIDHSQRPANGTILFTTKTMDECSHNKKKTLELFDSGFNRFSFHSENNMSQNHNWADSSSESINFTWAENSGGQLSASRSCSSSSDVSAVLVVSSSEEGNLNVLDSAEFPGPSPLPCLVSLSVSVVLSSVCKELTHLTMLNGGKVCPSQIKQHCTLHSAQKKNRRPFSCSNSPASFSKHHSRVYHDNLFDCVPAKVIPQTFVNIKNLDNKLYKKNYWYEKLRPSQSDPGLATKSQQSLLKTGTDENCESDMETVSDSLETSFVSGNCPFPDDSISADVIQMIGLPQANSSFLDDSPSVKLLSDTFTVRECHQPDVTLDLGHECGTIQPFYLKEDVVSCETRVNPCVSFDRQYIKSCCFPYNEISETNDIPISGSQDVMSSCIPVPSRTNCTMETPDCVVPMNQDENDIGLQHLNDVSLDLRFYGHSSFLELGMALVLQQTMNKISAKGDNLSTLNSDMNETVADLESKKNASF